MTSSLPINHRCLFLGWIVGFLFFCCLLSTSTTRDDTSGEGKRAEGKHNSCSLLLFNLSHSFQIATRGVHQIRHNQGVFTSATFCRHTWEVSSFTWITSLYGLSSLRDKALGSCIFQSLLIGITSSHVISLKGTAQPKHKNTYFFLVTVGIFISDCLAVSCQVLKVLAVVMSAFFQTELN